MTPNTQSRSHVVIDVKFGDDCHIRTYIITLECAIKFAREHFIIRTLQITSSNKQVNESEDLILQ